MPQSRPKDLIDFNSPPIAEVAVAIHFDSIRNFSQAYIGQFWNVIKSEFPNTLDQPPMVPINRDKIPQLQTTFSIEIVGGANLNRTWFLNDSGEKIVQLQNDRLILNWQKNESNKYEHFEPIAEEFLSIFQKFEKFCSENKFEMNNIVVEVTYINNIEAESIDQFTNAMDMHHLETSGINVISPYQQLTFRTDPTNELTSETWLDVAITPLAAQIESKGQQFNLTLTFISKLESSEPEKVEKTLLVGRRMIDNTFESITTPDMHERWDKK